MKPGRKGVRPGFVRPVHQIRARARRGFGSLGTADPRRHAPRGVPPRRAGVPPGLDRGFARGGGGPRGVRRLVRGRWREKRIRGRRGRSRQGAAHRGQPAFPGPARREPRHAGVRGADPRGGALGEARAGRAEAPAAERAVREGARAQGDPDELRVCLGVRRRGRRSVRRRDLLRGDGRKRDERGSHERFSRKRRSVSARARRARLDAQAPVARVAKTRGARG